MPTSANDRFERIFANRPRPAKPLGIGPSDSQDDNALEHQADRVSSVQSVDESKVATTVNHMPASDKRCSQPISDDDDEYVALFSKTPRMRNDQNTNQYSLESGVMKMFKDVHNEPAKPPELVTNSKPSAFGQFCPLRLVAVFPYKYMKDPDDRVSKQFFAANKFYNRSWSLYYICPPESLGKGPVLLIPRSEVQKLVDEISMTFKVVVKVPEAPFTLKFNDDGTPLPRFLGQSNSREEVTTLAESIPHPSPGHGECSASAPEVVRDAYKDFHEKIANALHALKGKGSASKNKARNLLRDFEESRNRLKRVQGYFGLRPCIATVEFASNLASNEVWKDRGLQQMVDGILIKFLNVNKPVQYSFNHEPVMISIDVESYERNHRLITEIGISTLDTLDLVGIPPNKGGSDWVKHIRSRHFRVKGREYLINKDFCVGNPEAFQFGQSEFITLDTVADTIDSCFQWPYSVQFKREGPESPAFYANSATLTSQRGIPEPAPPPSQRGPHTRNIILVGHNTATDISYLQSLNIQSLIPTSPNPILSTLDTATLYQTLTSATQPRNLAHICAHLGIDAWFTHNAGNDARYTLEALIKIAVQARLNEDEARRLKDPDSTGIIVDEVEVQSMRESDERLEHERQRAIQDAIEAEKRKEKSKQDEINLEESVRVWRLGGQGNQDVRW